MKTLQVFLLPFFCLFMDVISFCSRCCGLIFFTSQTYNCIPKTNEHTINYKYIHAQLRTLCIHLWRTRRYIVPVERHCPTYFLMFSSQHTYFFVDANLQTEHLTQPTPKLVWCQCGNFICFFFLFFCPQQLVITNNDS